MYDLLVAVHVLYVNTTRIEGGLFCECSIRRFELGQECLNACKNCNFMRTWKTGNEVLDVRWLMSPLPGPGCDVAAVFRMLSMSPPGIGEAVFSFSSARSVDG